MDKKEKYDLFNNPMINAAMKAMTPEQLEEYKRMGEYMFKTDFTHPEPKPVEVDIADGVFYVENAIKSGLTPEDMTDQELRLMVEVYGDTWYLKYGFRKEQIPALKPQIKPELLTKRQLKNLKKMVEKNKGKKKANRKVTK